MSDTIAGKKEHISKEDQDGAIIPYSSIQIYAELKDFKFALKTLVNTKESDRPILLKKIEALFKDSKGQPADLLVTLSVRTAWSLFLEMLNLPKGSEILMTSINIPDMVRIVREHGLIPVPVDINLATTAPTLEDLKAVTTPKSKVLMLSYIYGVIYPIEDIISYCRDHGILVVEDIAESYIGNSYIGHPNVAMSLFSFGSIKRCTAFAGALAFIRNKTLYEKMAATHETYKTQRKRECFKKMLKVGAMGILLNNQPINLYVKKASRLVNFDYKEFVVKNLRGFKAQGNFLKKFRKRPAVAVLKFMLYRLSNFDKEKLDLVNQRLKKAVDKLLENGIKIPGHAISERSFWLFPVIVPEVKKCSDMLNRRGVDAYLGATQLKPIHPNFGYKKPSKMYSFFDKILYMPISELVPEEVINKMVDEIVIVTKAVEKQIAKSEPQTKL